MTYAIYTRDASNPSDNWEIVPGGTEAEFDTVEEAEAMIEHLKTLPEWAAAEYDIREY